MTACRPSWLFLFTGRSLLNQPQTHIAGDTLTFTEQFADYPASDGWAAKWYLLGTNPVNYTADVDGDAFTWTITAAQTAAWPAGQYKSFIRLTKGVEAHTLNESFVTVKLNVATVGTGYDPRSDLRIMYDSVKEAVKKLSSKEVLSYSVVTPAGSQRSVTYKDLPELITQMHSLARSVRIEERELGIARGKKGGKIVVSMDPTL